MDAEKPIVRVVAPPTRCPVCSQPAEQTHTLTSNPPIHVWSCGCRVQYVPHPLNGGR